MTTRKDSEYAGYHQYDPNGTPYGSFEIFWDDSDISEHGGLPRNYDGEGNPVKPGWYFWPCFPGCLPDSEAIGPYATSKDAYEGALRGA